MAKTCLHAFKAKDTRFVADWLKSKGLHKLCSVFEGIQEPFILSLACKGVVYYCKPCTQLPEHNKSYRKVSRGWGHLITWNGPMMGDFSASGAGNLNKNFPKIQMPQGLPNRGMFKPRFDWYITTKHFNQSLRFFKIHVNKCIKSVGNWSFRLQVVLPTSRFTYIKVVSPTRPKSFRLHGLSRFAYTKYLLLKTKYLSKN